MLFKNVFFIFSLFLFNQQKPLKKLSGHAQGTTWSISYYSSSTILQPQIDSIFNNIDSSLSLYKPYSTIVAFNNSSTGVKLDTHLKNVIISSVKVTKETKGLSDITVGPLTELWGFTAKETNQIPDKKSIQTILPCIGSKNIFIRNDSLIKKKPCVKIDVNGIAQGYTVDIISNFLTSNNIHDYIVEVGGEVRVGGTKTGNTPFKVGIESPSRGDFSDQPMEKIVQLREGAITTSGNYRKYHESKGKKYSHIIDPRTGYSVQNSIISVTVYAKDATTADAYDNALMLMGVKNALKFVEARPQLAAFIIYANKNGSISDTASLRFRKLFIN
jgi:thiamine biosynthesis lipoprotein